MAPPVSQYESPPIQPATVAVSWRVPGWAIVPAITAPLFLIAGLIVAPLLHPPGYDSVRDTISALAARDAEHRAVMTIAFIGLGLSYVGVAAGLRGAGLAGRLVLAVGGLGTALVGVFPLPTGMGGSPPHAMSAMLAGFGMTLWPLGLAVRRTHPAWAERPFAARVNVAVGATIVFVLLFAWFGVEQWTRWGHVGLSERVAALCQSVWPLTAVMTARQQRRLSSPGAGETGPGTTDPAVEWERIP